MPITRNEAANAWIKLVLGVGFTAIGCFVVYLAIEMVGIFGEGMGVDEASRKIYSRAHIAVHVFGTASALAVGFFLNAKKPLLATFAVLAILGCGGYGIVNMIGFTTTNRLSVSESRTAATASDWKKYENARIDLQNYIKWLEGQAVQADSPREKRRMLNEIDAKRKELSAIEPPRPTTSNVLADPQATWFSQLTGWAAGSWQLALPVPLAFLLFAAEVLSFLFATCLIAGTLETLRNQRSLSGDGGVDGNGRQKRPEPGAEILTLPLRAAQAGQQSAQRNSPVTDGNNLAERPLKDDPVTNSTATVNSPYSSAANGARSIPDGPFPKFMDGPFPKSDGPFPKSDGPFPKSDGPFPKSDGPFPKSDGPYHLARPFQIPDGPFPTTSIPSVKQSTRHQHQISKSEAYADLQWLTAHGKRVPTQQALSKRWGRPKQTVSGWLEHWESRGSISREWHGKTRATSAA